MTKTHKHRTKVADIHYFKPVRDSRNYESSNPAVTGKIRGVVYEVPDDFYELEKKYRNGC